MQCIYTRSLTWYRFIGSKLYWRKLLVERSLAWEPRNSQRKERFLRFFASSDEGWLVVQCAWISAWGLRTNPDTQLLWWRGPCEHLGRHRQFTGVLLGMDLQIKNQQMKDKGICEDAELTEEMKLFLEQPNRVFLKQRFSWRGERKERKVWAWFHHWR